MVANVPVHGTVTIYTLIGDSFACLCVAITLVFTAWLFSSAIRSKWFPASTLKNSDSISAISESRSTHH
jgi:hypothetical protein